MGWRSAWAPLDRPKLSLLLTVLVALACNCPSALAVSTSNGGRYHLIGGVTGNSSVSSGGSFSLTGATCPVALPPQVPDRPKLSIHLANHQITISWSPRTTEFVLQLAETLPTGAWTSLPLGPDGAIVLPVGNRAHFFRLARVQAGFEAAAPASGTAGSPTTR